MEELKEKHTYLIDWFQTLNSKSGELQEIYIEKVTQKAVRIYFEDKDKSQWFDKTKDYNKVEILECIDRPTI